MLLNTKNFYFNRLPNLVVRVRNRAFWKVFFFFPGGQIYTNQIARFLECGRSTWTCLLDQVGGHAQASTPCVV